MTASALLAIVAAAIPTAFSVSLRARVARSEVRGSSDAFVSRSSVSRAVRSHVKVAARVFAAAPIDSRNASSATSRWIAAVRPGPSSASRPVTPSSIDSGSPPTRSATLGVATVAASMTVRHQPSAEDAVTFSHACA